MSKQLSVVMGIIVLLLVVIAVAVIAKSGGSTSQAAAPTQDQTVTQPGCVDPSGYQCGADPTGNFGNGTP